MRRARVWFRQWNLVLLVAAFAGTGGGCGGGRAVSISTTPADAMLKIDDVDTAPAPSTQTFRFSDGETHKVVASRFGYADQERVLSVDPKGKLVATYNETDGRQVVETVGDELKIALHPKRKQITINVTPVPAWVTLDGASIATSPVSQVTRWVEFSVGPDNHWLPHTVTASRPGYEDVSRSVEWTDPEPAVYNLALQPRRKDLNITSEPPGAEIFLNGESRGAEPVTIRNFAFPVNAVTGQALPQKITAKKPGYDPVDLVIGWDNGQTDYTLRLAGKTKTVRITTNPPGGTVKLDGSDLPRDASGVSTKTLAFPPVDDKGTLRVYAISASKKEGDKEWESAQFRIGWDNGQRDYTVPMSEVKSRTVLMVRPRFMYSDRDGTWRPTAETVPTVSPRDAAEPPTAAAGLTVTPVLRLPAAENGANPAVRIVETIDTLATSPDASQIVFTVLRIGPDGQPHSQLQILDLDGGPGNAGNARNAGNAGGPAAPPAPHGPRVLADDKGLSLYPSFSPDGKRVLFSSDRDGKRMGVWSVPADGSAAPVRVTAGESIDLWPTLDSLPQPRLFYEGLLDRRREPRLFSVRPGAGEAATYLAQTGFQPRVSPAADAVLFDMPGGAARENGKTPRHLFTIPDTGGPPAPLNHTADFDDFDPCWSKDGSQVAFASDRPRGATGAKGALGAGALADGDYNIWVTDPAHPQNAAVQLTFNGAWDDCPAWDAAGKAVYFRSNRGGSWGIWKVARK